MMSFLLGRTVQSSDVTLEFQLHKLHLNMLKAEIKVPAQVITSIMNQRKLIIEVLTETKNLRTLTGFYVLGAIEFLSAIAANSPKPPKSAKNPIARTFSEIVIARHAQLNRHSQ